MFWLLRIAICFLILASAVAVGDENQSDAIHCDYAFPGYRQARKKAIRKRILI